MFNVPFLTQMPSVLCPSVHLEGWESLQVTWGSWWGPVGTESNLSALLLQVTKSVLVSLVGKLHFPYISINETLKKGQTLTIIRETWVWIGKALYFFISQCRIYGVFSSAEWNHPCKVCGNLDVRDAIISSRKNSEFFQLECAEFGEFHICIIAVKGISASFECHISWFASAAVQDILVKTFKILIVELY